MCAIVIDVFPSAICLPSPCFARSTMDTKRRQNCARQKRNWYSTIRGAIRGSRFLALVTVGHICIHKSQVCTFSKSRAEKCRLLYCRCFQSRNICFRVNKTRKFEYLVEQKSCSGIPSTVKLGPQGVDRSSVQLLEYRTSESDVQFQTLISSWLALQCDV